MKKDIKTIKDTVKSVLSWDMRSRRDDKWLIIQVLRELGYSIRIPTDILYKIPSFESITRCRRKFQEEGLFLPDKMIQKNREDEQENMRKIGEWW